MNPICLLTELSALGPEERYRNSHLPNDFCRFHPHRGGVLEGPHKTALGVQLRCLQRPPDQVWDALHVGGESRRIAQGHRATGL